LVVTPIQTPPLGDIKVLSEPPAPRRALLTPNDLCVRLCRPYSGVLPTVLPLRLVVARLGGLLGSPTPPFSFFNWDGILTGHLLCGCTRRHPSPSSLALSQPPSHRVPPPWSRRPSSLSGPRSGATAMHGCKVATATAWGSGCGGRVATWGNDCGGIEWRPQRRASSIWRGGTWPDTKLDGPRLAFRPDGLTRPDMKEASSLIELGHIGSGQIGLRVGRPVWPILRPGLWRAVSRSL
jgi:hypothetical protein